MFGYVPLAAVAIGAIGSTTVATGWQPVVDAQTNLWSPVATGSGGGPYYLGSDANTFIVTNSSRYIAISNGAWNPVVTPDLVNYYSAYAYSQQLYSLFFSQDLGNVVGNYISGQFIQPNTIITATDPYDSLGFRIYFNKPMTGLTVDIPDLLVGINSSAQANWTPVDTEV